MRLSATRAAPRALLAAGVPGALHCLHLSSTAAHLRAADGSVLSLVADLSLASPCAAVVPALFVDGPGASPWRTLDRGGHGDGRRLVFSGAEIECAAAGPWNPRPGWNAARALLAVPEARNAVLVALAPFLPERLNVLDAEHAGALAEGLVSAEPEQARAAAARLVGRGPGLTPAGDDVLLGAFHALWCLGSGDEECVQRCAGVLGDAGGSTTALAGAWLVSGAAGEASFPWHALFESWAANDAAAASAALRQVAAVGASSGRAMLAGFGAVLRRAEQIAQPLR